MAHRYNDKSFLGLSFFCAIAIFLVTQDEHSKREMARSRFGKRAVIEIDNYAVAAKVHVMGGPTLS